MKNPLVSIIVPVYNVEPWLPACIDSLVNQSWLHAEIIFVNDGSTDGSLAVLQASAQRDQRIRVLTQENAGAGAARNHGLDTASGEYVIFVDGDDRIALNTVEDCIKQALDVDADIVCFGFRKVRKPDNDLETISSFEYEPGSFAADDHLDSFFAENSHRKEKLNTATMGKLYRRSLLEQHRIRFRLAVFEDTPFFLEAAYHAKKIARISGALYEYFIREKSVAARSTTGALISAEKISKFYTADAWVKDFLIRENIFGQYRAGYYRFHNARVLLYGGYFEVYVDGKGADDDAARLFLEHLRMHRKDVTFHRKGLYRAYRKRVFMLKVGLWLSDISLRLAHRFFVRYERTLAPK
ncbi:glycosyltransferase family 2 protein [Chitinophaga cymbidii]|nr:glycosyltransferase [Chitinophaga cymbidii]